MKKIFLRKTTIYFLTFMILINSILPTTVYAATIDFTTDNYVDSLKGIIDNDSDRQVIEAFMKDQVPPADKDAKFLKAEVTESGRYDYVAGMFVVKDGKAYFPSTADNGNESSIILEAGTTVYYKSSEGYSISTDMYTYFEETIEESLEDISVFIAENYGDAYTPKEAPDVEDAVPDDGEEDDNFYYYDESGDVHLYDDEFGEDGGIILGGGTTISVQEEQDDEAGLLEKILTHVFLYIGAGLSAVISAIVGESLSIEKVIFNQFSNTRLGFFEGSGVNDFIEYIQVKPFLNDLFNFFTGIAIVVYLIILVYMAIKIMLGATAEKGAKYKELLLYWVEGILILFLFPYVMKFSIEINDSFVFFIYANKDNTISESMPVIEYVEYDSLADAANDLDKTFETMAEKTDYMTMMYETGLEEGWLAYAVCWYIMFIQMIGFLVVYFKRVLIIMFLIAIFPLVMISYAVDKIGDAKSQAFGNWVKEFMMNVFVQSFHAITYVLIMSTISVFLNDAEKHWILIIISLSFISKGDDILRAIFSLNSGAGTVKGLGSTIAQAAAIRGISDTIRGARNDLFGPKSMFGRFRKRAGNFVDRSWAKASNRIETTARQIELDRLQGEQPQVVDLSKPLTPKELEKAIWKDMQTLLNKNGKATDEEIRAAMERLKGYKAKKDDKELQDMLKKLEDGLNVKQRKRINNLYELKSSVDKLMQGGRDIDVTQNINVIIKCLDRSGRSAASKAILGQIVESESDLIAADKLFGKVKFNKEGSGKNNSSTTRNTTTAKNKKISGRGAAKRRHADQIKAKSQLEYLMSKTVKVPTELTRKQKREEKKALKASKKSGKTWKNIKSVKDAQGTVPTSRAEKKRKPIDTALRYRTVTKSEETSGTSSGTSYGGKVPKKKTIESAPMPRNVQERRQAEAELKAKNKPQQEPPSKNSTVFKSGTGGGKPQSTSTIEPSSPITNMSSTTNTRRNVGETIASVQGSVEGLRNVLNRNIYNEKVNNALREVRENIQYTLATPNTSSPITVNFQGGKFSKETKKDFIKASESLGVLLSASSGEYTAKEILSSIKTLREAERKYGNASDEERKVIEEMVKELGCKPEDYEAYVRVKILNDPDSVGNNREIIEECKEFVTTTDMPSIIRNKLGYNLEDLRPGQNLKYVRSRDKEYDGIVSDAEVERRDREREITVLREEIASRIKDDEVKYAWRGLAREGAGVLIDGARAYGEIALKTAGAASVGFMASGMATSGKDQDIATKFFAGYAAADSLYNTADAAINGITDDLDQPSDNYNPIQTIENIRNRRKQKAKRKNNEETDEKTDEDSPISSDEE